MSSWSHSAIYVGDAMLRRDAATRADVQRRFGREAKHLIVEALVDKGVIVSPLVKYIDANIRICRPAGLKPEDLAIVLDHVIARIGLQYDRRNFWDLTRYLLPFQMIPAELREDALHFGSGARDGDDLLVAPGRGVRQGAVPDPARPRAAQARRRPASACASRSWAGPRAAPGAASCARGTRPSASPATSTSRPTSRS